MNITMIATMVFVCSMYLSLRVASFFAKSKDDKELEKMFEDNPKEYIDSLIFYITAKVSLVVAVVSYFDL